MFVEKYHLLWEGCCICPAMDKIKDMDKIEDS